MNPIPISPWMSYMTGIVPDYRYHFTAEVPSMRPLPPLCFIQCSLSSNTPEFISWHDLNPHLSISAKFRKEFRLVITCKSSRSPHQPRSTAARTYRYQHPPHPRTSTPASQKPLYALPGNERVTNGRTYVSVDSTKTSRLPEQSYELTKLWKTATNWRRKTQEMLINFKVHSKWKTELIRDKRVASQSRLAGVVHQQLLYYLR